MTGPFPGLMYPPPVHYCWVCDAPAASETLSARHYESGRRIYFCSVDHWSEYTELDGL